MHVIHHPIEGRRGQGERDRTEDNENEERRAAEGQTLRGGIRGRRERKDVLKEDKPREAHRQTLHPTSEALLLLK